MKNFNYKSALFLAVLLLAAVVAATYMITSNWDAISAGVNLGDADTDMSEVAPVEDETATGTDAVVDGEVSDEENNTGSEDSTEDNLRVDENGIEIAP